MGIIRTNITLVNPFDAERVRLGEIQEDSVRKMEVVALVDTGAEMLSINESIKTQLGLPVRETVEAELAEGSIISCEIVGPVDLHFKNRLTSCLALVLPGDSEVLLGAMAMEGMDVLICPKKGELIVNPAHPYIARTIVK
jgi:clan AA aspartic protease